MAHTKIIPPWAYQFDEPPMQLVKFSSRGLRGADLDQFVKRASVSFLSKLDQYKPQPGEILTHIIAMGATEAVGPNRNGDGFKEAMLKQYHPTFVSHGRLFRHHRNRDPSKSYGVIKASAYNDAMRRVELLGAINATKEAAERNGGLVGDEEAAIIERGDSYPGSMAIRVPYDVCSGCGNRAKTRAEYCGPELCKYGGLKDNIGKTFDDGTTLHADNPEGVFFDYSKVFRGADPISWATGQLKAASLNVEDHVFPDIRGGAALADALQVSSPLWLMCDACKSPILAGQLKIAQQLVNAEKNAEPLSPLDRSFVEEVFIPDCDTAPLRFEKLAHILAALNYAHCMLPLPAFLSVLTKEPVTKQASEAVAAVLPYAFSLLAEDPQLEQKLQHNPYLVTDSTTQNLRSWAVKQAAFWSLSRPQVVSRLQLATIRGCDVPEKRLIKQANFSPAAVELAKEYACYQLATLYTTHTMPDADFRMNLVIRANRMQA